MISGKVILINDYYVQILHTKHPIQQRKQRYCSHAILVVHDKNGIHYKEDGSIRIHDNTLITLEKPPPVQNIDVDFHHYREEHNASNTTKVLYFTNTKSARDKRESLSGVGLRCVFQTICRLPFLFYFQSFLSIIVQGGETLLQHLANYNKLGADLDYQIKHYLGLRYNHYSLNIRIDFC